MFRTHFVCFALALLLAFCYVFCLPALAQEVDCDDIYCFSPDDFSAQEPVEGICITKLPDAASGTVLLGTRVIRPGDILTAEQLNSLTFSPLLTRADVQAAVSYLPIFRDHVSPEATMTLSIRGKEDKAPVSQDCAYETYKNLPCEGKLKSEDPEEKELTYSLIRKPRRGEVEFHADGTFTYTPKKNKVGVDSFTFTAADPAGHVSREATVTVQILKPQAEGQYTDTVGKSCRFAAEWMKNTGLFVGEQVGGADCFFPEHPVSRGEFLTMAVKCLNLPVDLQQTYASIPEEVPHWLRPYVAAAMRSGLMTNLPETYPLETAITGGEAAVMLQNILDFQTPEKEASAGIPTWAQDAVSALSSQGLELDSAASLTRGQVAELLYQVSKLSETAPGTALIPVSK